MSHLTTSNRPGNHRLFYQSPEHQTAIPGCAPVETKRKLFPICLKVGGIKRTLVRPQYLSFKQACNPMHARLCNVCWISSIREYGSIVNVFVYEQIVGTAPTIGRHHRTWRNIITYKPCQITSRGIGHMPHTHPPKTFRILDLHSNDYDTFACATTTFPTVFNAFDKRFIHFHMANQWFSFHTNHGYPVAL